MVSGNSTYLAFGKFRFWPQCCSAKTPAASRGG